MLKFKASFDDGCAYDMRVAKFLRDTEFDGEVTFYIPSAWEHVNRQHGDDPLSIEDLIELSKEFKIGSHTITHPLLTRITLGQAFDEIISSKQHLQDILGFEIEDFCYPRGYANDQLRDIVRKRYKRARNTLVGNLLPPTDSVWETPTIHIGVNRKEYQEANWYDEAVRLLGEAIELSRNNPEKDYIYHIWGHSWEINKNKEWDSFFDLLTKIKSVRILL